MLGIAQDGNAVVAHAEEGGDSLGIDLEDRSVFIALGGDDDGEEYAVEPEAEILLGCVVYHVFVPCPLVIFPHRIFTYALHTEE